MYIPFSRSILAAKNGAAIVVSTSAAAPAAAAAVPAVTTADTDNAKAQPAVTAVTVQKKYRKTKERYRKI